VVVDYAGVRALDGVDVAWQAGGIHAVVGQNGAGKSTMAKVCAGLVRPAQGHVEILGRPLGEGDATELGLAMVHQHFILPPSFTVAEALEATTKGSRRPWSRRALAGRWSDRLATLGITVDVGTRIRDLPIETRQHLEIARALSTGAAVLVLDEPTAVLAPAAIDGLFERLRALNERGVTLVVILHKLAEVFAIADTVTVLRSGRLELPPTTASTLTVREVSDAVIGSSVGDQPARTRAGTRPQASVPLLELKGVSTAVAGAEPPLESIDLALHAGEVVGIAGVEGNGQRSLAEVVAGLIPTTAGTVLMTGEDVTRATAAGRRRAGLRVVPFDRNAEGVSQTSSLWENVAVGTVLAAPRPWVEPKRLRAAALGTLTAWDVRFRSVDQLAKELSGGNVQRLILGRELAAGASVVIAAHPTRGLDFVATTAVHDALVDLAAGGAAVLVISSDLDELFELATEVKVLRGGAVAAGFRPPYDRAAVGDAMLGMS